jgi:hypothetical protein
MQEKGAVKNMKPKRGASSMRPTMTFPSDLYETLDEIAKQK